MAREVTSRMNQIIKILITSKCRNLKEIADLLGITLRQVRYDIDRINNDFIYDQMMIETDNKGNIVINDLECLEKFYLTKKNEFKCSKEQRITLLLNIIAFNIAELNLNEISKKINVTRVTIKNDLNEVKKILESYDLKLMYVNRFCLVGEAEDIFEFRLNVLSTIEYALYKEHFEKIEELILEYIKKDLLDHRLRDVIPTITCFLRDNDILIKDTDLNWLIRNILLVLWYIYKKIEIPNDKHRIVSILEFTYAKLFDGLEKFINTTISNENRTKIMKIISSVCEQDVLLTDNFNNKVIRYIFNLIILFPDKYQDIFISDSMLLSGLYSHLNCRVKKMDALVDINDINKCQIKLDTCVDEIIDRYCDENTEVINLSNICDKELLKVHFVSSIYRHRLCMTKQVVLVSGASKFAKKRLKIVLESLFEVSVKEIISIYELPFFDEWQDIDVILFTEKIPKYFNQDIPMAMIKLVLDNDDIGVLNRLDIYPKEHYIDLQELYLELDFLQQEDQLAVIDIVSKYLEKQMFMTKNKLKNLVNYKVDIINNISFNQNYIQLTHDVLGVFQKNICNYIEIMIDRNKHYSAIKINATSPVELLYILFDSYKKIGKYCLFDLSNDKIIELMLG